MSRGPRTRTATFIAIVMLAASAIAGPAAGVVRIRAAVPAGSSGVAATSITAGGPMSCATLKGDQLKCWGSNGDGQLGQGDTLSRGKNPGELGDFLPTIDLGTGRKVRSVAVGRASICAVLDNSRAKCWGNNNDGQLGYGDTASRGDGPGEMGNNLPHVQLGAKRRVKSLAAGEAHTCALLDNGTVKCWGRNDSGQLGIDDVSGDKFSIGDAAGEMGDALVAVALGRRARAIGAGNSFSCALLDNGTVKCWGENYDGQLGQGDTNQRGDAAGEMAALQPVPLGRKATAIGVGESHVCALLDNGTVKCWGANREGQLGQGDTLSRGDEAGEMASLQPVQLGTGRKVKKLIVGGIGYHNCALLDNGAYKCWGYNDFSGTLGLGDLVNHGDGPGEMGDNLPALDVGSGRKIKAIVGGSDHTCSLLDNATVKWWGWDRQGLLGLGDTDHRGDDESIDGVPAVNLGVRVRSINATGYHGCVLLENRTVQCWGYNDNGQLGYGDFEYRGDDSNEMGNNLPAVDFGTGRSVKFLATGASDAHSCAILDTNSLTCWGTGLGGRLGYGDIENRGDGPDEMGANLRTVDLGVGRTAKAVAMGARHTCAILDDGKAKCWGRNSEGQLGIGDTADRGDDSNEMGNNLPYAELGTGRKARALAAGIDHTCAILDNGRVKCWGDNQHGQLGLGDDVRRGDGQGEMGNNLPYVDLGTGRKAKSISAGLYHTCALLDNGTVKCWGWNTFGQLGLGDVEHRGDQADEMGDDLAAVDFGTGRKVKSLSSGGYQNCALLDIGTVKCWGYNSDGSLGYGDTAHRGDQAEEMGDYLAAVALGGSRRALSVSVGGFSCALLDDYSVRCWGYNGEGQLGQGDTTDRGDNPNEMGSNLRPVPMTG